METSEGAEQSEEEESFIMELLDSERFYFHQFEREREVAITSVAVAGGFVCKNTSNFSSSATCSCPATKEEVRFKNRISPHQEVAASSNKLGKRQRRGAPSSASLNTIKVRKDKLGDKISELQQLVSPFGKSDTASVLHEALGYIHFLHDQVQVLSAPYFLQRHLPTTTTSSLQLFPGGEGEMSEGCGELRSRGLCLVPVTCTAEVANDNGAHLWSPGNH